MTVLYIWMYYMCAFMYGFINKSIARSVNLDPLVNFSCSTKEIQPKNIVVEKNCMASLLWVVCVCICVQSITNKPQKLHTSEYTYIP